MEAIDLKRPSGKGKAAGITFCLAGVLVIALYAGSSLSPLNHSHHGVLLAGHHGDRQAPGHVSKGLWITGTFLMLLACVAWSLWIVLQVIDRSN
jgi:drug/metabolite transporter (DMT)-like permease